MSSEIKRALLGRLAIHAGLVTQQQVIECLNEQQEQFKAKKKVPRLGEILYWKGYLSKEQVRALLLYRKSITAPAPVSEKDISVIGDYEILDKFETDATGTTYKARNKQTEDIVSLKVMSREMMDCANFRERFVNETKRVASLDHPNISRIITVGCKDNHYFYTSEYIEGSSLKQILDDKKKLDVEEATRIARELAGALRHGHEKGIVHGDVRPSNVLIGSNGNVRLVEFGVLKDTLRNLMRLLGTTDTVGFYISPEQAIGDRVVSEHGDIYSLGAVYYHMLVGKPPFEGESPLASLVRLCEERFTSPHEADNSIPEAVSDIVVKMLSAEPSGRHETMAEVENDLVSCIGEEAEPHVSAVPPEMPARRELHRAQNKHSAKPASSLWGIIIVVGSVLVLGAVVLAAFLMYSELEEKASPVEESSPEEPEVTPEREKPESKPEPGKAEPEPKPKKPITKEESNFGRGGSLFAPPGWNPPKEEEPE